ncbi:MAG: transcriptional repressor NrdR [Tissierellia bacterium]|nr:transcriptional repressor NrdR [Tissierellia bacterium]
MKCPFCGSLDTKVVDSRPVDKDSSIRRRRECENCEKRFTTYEKYEDNSLMVIKKNKARENFDRNKILKSMLKACNKREVSRETLEEATNDIEIELNYLNKREVSSQFIGELIMDKLKNIDQVAYVRFASVYREFKDLDSFYEEIENLKKK